MSRQPQMTDMKGRIEVLADPPALALRVAEWMTDSAIASKGIFRVALSGGSTPKPVYELLASAELRARFPWDRVCWYWGDERFVPHDHPDSNYRMAYDAMLSKVPVPAERIFPVPVDGTPEQGALRYEHTLQQAYGGVKLDRTKPLFDITLLGLGPDGHTASLLPGQAVLEERARWVAAVPHGGPEARITLTYPALESSRCLAFLVTGRQKAAIVREIRSGRSETPAARIQPCGELIWFLDREAFEGADRADERGSACEQGT